MTSSSETVWLPSSDESIGPVTILDARGRLFCGRGSARSEHRAVLNHRRCPCYLETDARRFATVGWKI